MYVTVKAECYAISRGDSDDEPVRSEVVSILQSNHEEMKADLKCIDLCACLDCQNRVAANTEGMLSDAEDELADESEFDCSDDL